MVVESSVLTITRTMETTRAKMSDDTIISINVMPVSGCLVI